MKWLVLLCLVFGLLLAVFADDEENEYISRYAELASPLPANVNVQELLASLAAAGNHQ